MESYNIPGIVKISKVLREHVSAGAGEMRSRGIPAAIVAPHTEISYTGTPTLKVQSKRVNGRRQGTVTLEYDTTDRSELPWGYVYVAETASGRQYMIGDNEGREVQIEYSDDSGTPSGKASVRHYKLTHIGQHTPVECVM